MTRKTITIVGQNYPFSYACDAAGNLQQIVHPDGYTINYSYQGRRKK
ncbi:MAG: hypothetical protein HKP58_07610 [Desulfatitalea sp.]|nr:hypothetical protein [Desulfatitalea sp.]NNK00265.1 hypothetical protein [Desulfatitalea sp.]